MEPRVPPPAAALALAAALLAAASQGGTFPHPWAWLSRVAQLPFPPVWKMTGQAFLGHLLHLGAALGISLLFAASGRALLRFFRVRLVHPLEGWVLGLGLGCCAWGYLFFALGALGLLYRPVLASLLVCGAAAAAWSARGGESGASPSTSVPRSGAAWRSPLEEMSAASTLRLSPAWFAGAALAVTAIGLHLPYALVPETFYDALEYHLELPSLYLLNHRILPTPDNTMSGIPSIPQMLFGWALAADPMGVVAHALHWSFFPWTALGLLCLAGRLGCPRAGALAAAIFCVAPIVSVESYRTSVGMEWALFQLGMAHAFLAALDQPEGSPERRGWLLLSGVFLGLCLSTKYPAWILPLAFLLVNEGTRLLEGRRPCSLRELGIVFGVGGALLLPWLAKNAYFYANPIYPVLQELWAPRSEVLPNWGYMTGEARTLSSLAGLKEYLLHPWAMSFFRGDLLSSLGPVFLGLLPGLAFLKLGPKARLLGWFVAGAWIPLSLLVNLPRFMIPSFALLALLLSMMVTETRPEGLRRFLTAAVYSALLAAGLAYWGGPLPRSQWNVFLGLQSRSEFLGHTNAAYYPTPPYAGMEYLNREGAPGSKVLLFGDGRGFYLQRSHLLSTPGQPTVLERWSNASKDGRDLKSRFDAAGVTHILVNHGEIFREFPRYRFSRKGMRALDEFWKRYTLKVFQAGPGRIPLGDGRLMKDRWVAVYRLMSEEEADRDHPSDDFFATFEVAEDVSRPPSASVPSGRPAARPGPKGPSPE